MRFREVFRFELGYQARRGWPWLTAAVLLVFSFTFVRVNFVADALYADHAVNAPFLIAGATVFGGLLWLLMGAAVAGDAAARDVATGMHPLVYTVPLGRADYLGGRFLAAFVLNGLILLAVQAGILLAVYAPGVHPDTVAPFRPAAYLTAYAFIALPNALATTAVQFLLAVRSGRAMSAYLGSVILIFLAFFVASVLLFRQTLGTLLDPTGIRFIVEDLAHAWTTAEQNSRLIWLEDQVLTNRLVWVGVALGTLAFAHLRFRFAHRTERTWRGRWRRRGGQTTIAADAAPRPMRSHEPAARTFGVRTQVRQTLALARKSFVAIATSWAGLGLLVVVPLLTVPVVIDQMVSSGVPLVPTTIRVIDELTAPISAELSRWVIVPLLIVVFAGELVWREREAGVSEIADAMPGSEWIPLLGTCLGLALVLVTFLALVTAAGVTAQLLLGYQDVRIDLYLTIVLGLQLVEYLLFVLLAVAVHVVVNHKYIGHVLAIAAYAFIAVLASMLGVEHDLLVYGAGPPWSYTDMRGFGGSLAPWVWFRLYWAAWALLLAVVARLLWVRGRDTRAATRLAIARRRVSGATGWTAAAGVILVLSVGGYVFYNTNVVNEYLGASEVAQRRAEYERRYARYADLPQPQLTRAALHVEIHPDRRAVHIRGTYHLVNENAAPIEAIHVALPIGEIETAAVRFDRPASLTVHDETHGYRVYALEAPVRPGEATTLDFQVDVAPRGFREAGVSDSVVANGTSFTHAWLPAVGYQESRELMTAGDRRAHGLAPRPIIPALDDVEARTRRGRGVVLETVIGTSADQIAVAPGMLRRSWMDGGRRYVHYATDGPIGREWAFFSADYEVQEARWERPEGPGQTVAIRIFHQPAQTAHLKRVMRGVRASLGYYTKAFGPYPYDHLTIVEAPGNGVGMHAEASMLSYAEGFALWGHDDDPARFDLPFAVVAHEMAHQWTVPYASVEGAPVMSESLAWYYAMRVVEETYGDQIERLLRFMRQPHPYPPIRRGEPLLRGLDPYMSYRKGPLALHALGEYIGTERVNAALRRLLETHRSPGEPLATTLDLYRELQAVTPPSLQYLLHDLFEVNTWWSFETERVTATENATGAWDVTLEVRTRKVVVDETGVETEVPMDEPVELGIFGTPAAGGGELGQPLYVRMHRVRSGRQTITATVPARPALAGIDPYHVLDWEPPADDDNLVTVGIGR